MIKRLFILGLTGWMAIVLCACQQPRKAGPESRRYQSRTAKEEKRDKMTDYITLKLKNQTISLELEDNQATRTLVDKLSQGDIEISLSDYGGFEKVGNLPFSLPTDDTHQTAEAGDVMLYQGDKLVIFYSSNSWSYTKLGHISGYSGKELQQILGQGKVTLSMSLKN
ncbi:cyclophilin-like fold protein [Streptococcus devriesei]|uniref:cyclophilin-like fold protein n=1 Tax=Streptococcus devriesei TaxID=231233 RepID=UPI0004179BFE|nr:cyclophilin-like fold protein [Streptococcus devriesei]